MVGSICEHEMNGDLEQSMNWRRRVDCRRLPAAPDM
jgi:hypothetical protein